MPVIRVAASGLPAVSPADFLVDIVVGAVIFVLVVVVAAILMFILQAVLPGGSDAAAGTPETHAAEVADAAEPGAHERAAAAEDQVAG